MPECVGSPTFNQIYKGAITEWPDKIPGWICKAPPFGYYSAPRFENCCSGKVYNITTPSTPDDEWYPMSCALFCQVDEAHLTRNDKYPYGWDEHFMCLTNGGEPYHGEVICASNSPVKAPAPSTWPSTWTGAWQTKSYALDEGRFP